MPPVGVEPTYSGFSVQRLNQLSYSGESGDPFGSVAFGILLALGLLDVQADILGQALDVLQQLTGTSSSNLISLGLELLVFGLEAIEEILHLSDSSKAHMIQLQGKKKLAEQDSNL